MLNMKLPFLKPRTIWLLFSLLITAVNAAQATSSNSQLPYAGMGALSVGYQPLNIDPASGLSALIWYPNQATTETSRRPYYRYEVKLFSPFKEVTVAKSNANAVFEADMSIREQLPLVILSPGFALSSAAYGWLAERIASHGYVVISPDHQEQLDGDLTYLWRSAMTRPSDIQKVMAFVIQHSQNGGSLTNLVDTENVAVVGHSYGGYTALAASGAQISTPDFVDHCDRAIAEQHQAAWLCETLQPHLKDMASLNNFSDVPDELWGTQKLPNIKAAISLAGDAFFYGKRGLAKIDVPVLAIGGTLDHDSPHSWSTQPTYDYTNSSRKALVMIEQAEHMIFTSTCDKRPLLTRWLAKEFCTDSYLQRDVAHDIISHFVISFLEVELKDNLSAALAFQRQYTHQTSVQIDMMSQGY